MNQEPGNLTEIIGKLFGWIGGTAAVITGIFAYLTKRQEIKYGAKATEDKQDSDDFDRVNDKLFLMIDRLEKELVSVETRKEMRAQELEAIALKKDKELEILQSKYNKLKNKSEMQASVIRRVYSVLTPEQRRSVGNAAEYIETE